MSKEEKEGRLRTESVIINEVEIYKLPQSQVSRSSAYYWIKETRDWIWLKFSFDEEKIIRITLILADKKVSEARNLMEKEKYALVLESYQKAIEKLKTKKPVVKKSSPIRKTVKTVKPAKVEKTKTKKKVDKKKEEKSKKHDKKSHKKKSKKK